MLCQLRAGEDTTLPTPALTVLLLPFVMAALLAFERLQLASSVRPLISDVFVLEDFALDFDFLVVSVFLLVLVALEYLLEGDFAFGAE